MMLKLEVFPRVLSKIVGEDFKPMQDDQAGRKNSGATWLTIGTLRSTTATSTKTSPQNRTLL